ncbi:YvcK family protein [Candidatus Uhrbacteria bacterium]|nr:YvcK family protein [Candidatus Uhrbacteria bacterium]
MKNIVIIGGGTGTLTLLKGLRSFPTNNSVIVSTADDGGSTGRLRKELNVMPPGDLRQCLLGLSFTDPILQKLFSYRFDRGSLLGHTVGNILIAALEKITGNIEEALKLCAKLLNVRGQVVPVMLASTKLSATLENGIRIMGEHHIDEPRYNGNLKIVAMKLSPVGPANHRAIRLIHDADAIVFGPGDLYTSTLPNILVRGMADAIRSSKAQKILVANIMTKFGQTNGFAASDFFTTLNRYLGAHNGKDGIDVVIVNTKKPTSALLKKYKLGKAEFVQPDIDECRKKGARVIASDFIANGTIKKVKGDSLQRSILRHDSEKIAKAIFDCVR